MKQQEMTTLTFEETNFKIVRAVDIKIKLPHPHERKD